MNSDKLTPLGKLLTTAAAGCVPLNIFFELTHRCNQVCVHCCFSGAGKELGAEKIKSVLGEAAEMGALFLTLTGGEPLLRDDFGDIAAHAKSLHFATRIFTNATLIDERAADKIAEIAPIEVDISVYGPDAALHDRISRLPGSFDKTLRAVGLLKERKVAVSLKSMLMKENLERYGEIFALADSLGAACRIDPTITARADGDPAPTGHRVETERLREVIADRRIFSGMEPAPPGRGASCGVGNTELSITPAGDVIPCIQWRARAGNVTEQPLREIWENSPVFGFLRELSNAEGAPECRECDLAGWCARCPGIAETEAGGWDRPYEWACEVARMLKDRVRGAG